MTKVYICAGWAGSLKENDFHFITCAKLRKLYGIPDNHPLVVDVPSREIGKRYKSSIGYFLEPTISGRYTLPKEVKDLLGLKDL